MRGHHPTGSSWLAKSSVGTRGQSSSAADRCCANVVLPAPPQPSIPTSRTLPGLARRSAARSSNRRTCPSTASVCRTRNCHWRSAACPRRCTVPGPKICSVDDCTRLAVTRGLCVAHYGRLRRTGSVDADRPIGVKSSPKQCAVEGCRAIATERGWCHGHYLRWVRLGELQPERPLSRQVNFSCSVD